MYTLSSLSIGIVRCKCVNWMGMENSVCVLNEPRISPKKKKRKKATWKKRLLVLGGFFCFFCTLQCRLDWNSHGRRWVWAFFSSGAIQTLHCHAVLKTGGAQKGSFYSLIRRHAAPLKKRLCGLRRGVLFELNKTPSDCSASQAGKQMRAPSAGTGSATCSTRHRLHSLYRVHADVKERG